MTVKEKQNVTLPCKVAGFPPAVITWYKNGHVIDEDRRHFKKRNLEIEEIKFEERGIYTCTAENLMGRVQLSVNVTVKGMHQENKVLRVRFNDIYALVKHLKHETSSLFQDKLP